MKLYSPAALAALEAGASRDVGAVKVACDPAFRAWGGYGTLMLAGEPYQGLGDRLLVKVTGGALGVAAEGSEIRLSRADAAVQAMLGASGLWRAPVVVWRLVFDQGGRNVLDAHAFQRGRLDGMSDEAVPGATSALVLKIEGAARGQGRSTGRMRADADQRLIDPTDGGFRNIAAFAEKQMMWGGRRPRRAGDLFGGGPLAPRDPHMEP